MQAFVKRDDELGFGISGSKLRKYASLLPFLQKQNKPVAIVGSCYSNHVLSLTQLVKERGIPYRLFLKQPSQKTSPTGNYFFLSLLTQKEEITLLPSLPKILTSPWIEEQEKKAGQKFLWIPPGAFMEESFPGALTLSLDLSSHPFDHLFVEAGTGLMAASLILGLHFLQKKSTVHVVCLADSLEAFEHNLILCHGWMEKFTKKSLSKPSCYRLLLPATAKSFGSCNQTVFREILHTAKEEGIFVDPLYTAKLFLTARAQIKALNLSKTLLIHSGGSLALSGFQEALSQKNFTDLYDK